MRVTTTPGSKAQPNATRIFSAYHSKAVGHVGFQPLARSLAFESRFCDIVFYIKLIPPAHISKIENNQVDLRLSSLIALANALDLEVTLMPRKAMPFFSNLLPERHLRTYLADTARVHPEREFFLLWASEKHHLPMDQNE